MFRIVYVLFLILCLCSPCQAARHNRLASKQAWVSIDERGRLAELHGMKGETLLRWPVEVKVVDSLSGKAALLSSAPAQEISLQGSTVSQKRALSALKLAVQETMNLDTELRWTVQLENLTDQRRELMIEYFFKLDARETQPFFAAGADHPGWPQAGKLAYGYYRWDEGVRWGLPVAAVYSKGRDLGISFAPELEDHIMPISCVMERQGDTARVHIRRRYVRLEPKGTAKRTLYLAAHEGDWRPALAWVRNRWQKHFYAQLPNTEQYLLLGLGGSAPGLALEKNMPYMLDYRFQKWYGLDVPTDEEWRVHIDTPLWRMRQDGVEGLPGPEANYEEVLAWFEKGEFDVPEKYRGTAAEMALGYDASEFPYRVTRDHVNAYLDYVHEQGFKGVWYTDFPEAWGALHVQGISQRHRARSRRVLSHSTTYPPRTSMSLPITLGKATPRIRADDQVWPPHRAAGGKPVYPVSQGGWHLYRPGLPFRNRLVQGRRPLDRLWTARLQHLLRVRQLPETGPGDLPCQGQGGLVEHPRAYR